MRRQHGELLQHVILCAGESLIVIADFFVIDEQRQALKASQGSGRAAHARTDGSKEPIVLFNVTVQGDVGKAQFLRGMPRLSALGSVSATVVQMRTQTYYA